MTSNIINSKQNVEVIEKYLGYLNGRCIFKLKGQKHDIMTKRILHVDVISQTLLTSETLYACETRDVLTVDELIDIYDDVIAGKNRLRFIKPNTLEKPNDIMKGKYR